MNTPIVFDYKGSKISFANGKNVMVNATEMAKSFDKRPAKWLELPSTKEFLAALTAIRKSDTALIQTNSGGINGGGGTWMHEDVALEFARWLNPAFAIWCNDRIKELLKYGMTATQPTLEQMVDNPDLVISLASKLKEERAERERLQMQNAKLQPKANFADAAFECVTSYIDIGQAAKVLNLPFGRNTLFKKLREDGIFFASKNEPKQRFVDAKYFKLTQLPPIERENHAPIITMKVLCTQKGLAYINQLYGGNKTPNKIAIIK